MSWENGPMEIAAGSHASVGVISRRHVYPEKDEEKTN